MNSIVKKICVLMLAAMLVPVMLAGCSNKKEAAAPPPPRSSIEQIDVARTSAAKINIQSDQELAPLNIKVEAKNFTVTLSGTVNSEEQKKRAGTLAGSVSGVKQVINNLTVKNSE